MTQSNIRSSLTAAFSKSGFSDFVTNTKLRKSAVTVVHDKYKGEKSNVALHMCHAEETAKKFYRMVEKGDNSIACARILKNITTQSMPSRIVDSDCHVQDTQNLMLNLSANGSCDVEAMASRAVVSDSHVDVSENPSTILSSACKNSSLVGTSQDDINSCGDLFETENEEDNDPQRAPYKALGKRILWSPENRELIRSKFEHIIKQQKSPVEEVRSIQQGDLSFVAKLERNLGQSGRQLEHTVKYKIRTFFRNKYAVRPKKINN